MKYKIGQELYYVNPFVFTIEKVIIAFYDDENYVDNSGAYLEAKDLFTSGGTAKFHARSYLETFYHNRIREINKTGE